MKCGRIKKVEIAEGTVSRQDEADGLIYKSQKEGYGRSNREGEGHAPGQRSTAPRPNTIYDNRKSESSGGVGEFLKLWRKGREAGPGGGGVYQKNYHCEG